MWKRSLCRVIGHFMTDIPKGFKGNVAAMDNGEK
jgi:hypothetical protein